MNGSVEIVINGRFLTQKITGVQRYAHELLGALDAVVSERPNLSVRVVSPSLPGPPPNWKNLVYERVGYLTGHAWEQLELPLFTRNRILFCPANTAPIAALYGMAKRTVVCVHDLSYLYFPSAYTTSFRLLYNTIIPLVMRRADKLITVSESERKSISSRYATC